VNRLTSGANIEERGFKVWDDMGVEAEVAEFLYGLVRVWKPAEIVESGTGRGYATFALAIGLEANRGGHLTTFEPIPDLQAEAKHRLAGSKVVTFKDGYSADHEHSPSTDMVFLDSWGAERPRELAYWLPRDVRLVVHDAHEHAHHLDGGWLIDTPRGLWVRP